VTVFSGIVSSESHTALEPRILDIINTIDASNFFVGVRFARSSASMPKAAGVTRPIKKWMAEHDADDVLKMSSLDLPTTSISIGDWILELRLIARSPEFLEEILGALAAVTEVEIERLFTPGALDRLVLAGGGVPRDYISFVSESIAVAKGRGVSAKTGTERVIAEDVNEAAGRIVETKFNDLAEDAGAEAAELRELVVALTNHCRQTLRPAS
jgi:hypothetical protein